MVLVTMPTRKQQIVFGDPFYNELLGYFTLPQLLSNYGLPSSVLIYAWSLDPLFKAPYDPFSVVVIYADIGIMAEYIASNEVVGDMYRGCPTQGYLTLRTWDPKLGISLLQIASMGAGDGVNENSFEHFKPLQEATSMSLDDFYLRFKDPASTKCLEAPVDIWDR